MEAVEQRLGGLDEYFMGAGGVNKSPGTVDEQTALSTLDSGCSALVKRDLASRHSLSVLCAALSLDF